VPLTPPPSRFAISLFATPGDVYQEVFYSVLRAGHLIGGPDHHIRRDHFPGHELILCIRGRGWIRVEGRTHQVEPAQFVWVNCHQPHEHGAVADDPWEVYWIRVEGPKLARISELLKVLSWPVFVGFDHAAARPLYEDIFRLVASETPEAPALIHGKVAQLVALAFAARQATEGALEPAVPPALRRAVERMKLFFFERHRVEELATLSGMSTSHFTRTFRAVFGTSPIDWLRRERINQAKRRLVETRDSVKLIAEQVGYGDRFFFSKDFKQLTGMTPLEFRASESQG
jgi:AraC-like DNA-binding protein